MNRYCSYVAIILLLSRKLLLFTRYHGGNVSCPFDEPRIGLTGFRDKVVLPVTACEFEKIFARVDGRIHRLHYSCRFEK